MRPESTTRKEIVDIRLKEAGWNVADRTQILVEFFVSPTDGSTASPIAREGLANLAAHSSREFSDYVLLGKNGKPLAVVEVDDYRLKAGRIYLRLKVA